MPLYEVSPFYREGTATFVAGTAVTGQGTEWASNAEPGDIIYNQVGQAAEIAAVNSDTSLTLVVAFAGTLQAAQPYAIQRVSDAVRLENFNQRMVNLLKGGVLSAIGALDGTGGNKLIKLTGAGAAEAFNGANLIAEAAIDGTGGNWLSYFTGSGTKARTAFTAKARALLSRVDASGMQDELGFSAFIKTLLNDADAAAARDTLGAQPAGNYQAALGYTPLNKAGDGLSGPLALLATNSSSNYQLENTVTVTLSANAAIVLSNFSGFVLLNTTSGGGVALWLLGGGSVLKVGENKATNLTGIFDSTNLRYGFRNDFASPQSFTMTCIRTRVSA